MEPDRWLRPRDAGGARVKNISVALTEQQVLLRQKDVTRRLGWQKLQAGTLLQPIRKGQGLKKGEKVTKVGGPVRVLSVRREPLRQLLDDQTYGLAEVVREGFPGLTPRQFVVFFMASHDCLAYDLVTRIEFKYIDRRGS